MCFTFKKNNKQTKKPVSCFLQDDASAGIQSLQTSIEIKLPKPMERAIDMGGPSQRYQDGTSPSDFIVELVLDDTFFDRVIRCTNNHGQGDQKYSYLISKVFWQM